jgi:hypothetical protein
MPLAYSLSASPAVPFRCPGVHVSFGFEVGWQVECSSFCTVAQHKMFILSSC